MIIPSVYNNIETWSHINKSELKELENIQAKILKRILKLPKSTPYFGLLSDLGIWPIKYLIDYKKILLLQNILESDDKRILKQIIESEINNTWPGCWFQSVKDIMEKYDINLEEIKNNSKVTIKERIKIMIKEKLNSELQINKLEMKKLRFINEFSLKDYIHKLDYKDSILMLKSRLNMLDVKDNFKNKYNSLLCETCKKRETTQHLLICPEKSNLKEQDITNQNIKIIDYIKINMKRRENKT